MADKPIFPIFYEFRKRLREKKLRERLFDGAIDHTIMGAGSAGAKKVEERVLKKLSGRP